VGRPRLPSPERRARARSSQEKWKEANKERYLEKKAECAARPEYKARRRELYSLRQFIVDEFARYRQRLGEIDELGEFVRCQDRTRNPGDAFLSAQ